MPSRLEITLKPEIFDAEGEALCRKANDYFGYRIASVRTVNILTMDMGLKGQQLESIRQEAFTNPVVQVSSYDPLDIDFDWILWIGYRPGVRDNPGSTAVEAIEDLLGIRLKPHEGVYTSKRYCLKGGDLAFEDADRIARELLANDIIQ
ncbi:MAG: phosphoribosylformylglycinamidine synthase subunit PurS, partial [Thermodesulfobacteriota bacterium]|nr:phosphoribosylformylglycinamidine synthase subunit PurS [Thermodesulfobacteriota bacterium]